MLFHDDIFLLRKEKIGWLSIISWVLVLLLSQGPGLIGYKFLLVNPTLWAVIGWFATSFWVAMDASYRRLSAVWWTILWIVTGPIGLAIYFLKRQPMQSICYRCGNRLSITDGSCRSCGWQSYNNRIREMLQSAYVNIKDSLSGEPNISSCRTVAYTAAVCGALSAFGFVIDGTIIGAISGIVFALYWILVAYWVYLDAKWRKMEPLPWTALVLLSNLVGLATYLVIRHRDPATCPQCQALLSIGLKHCPYCGSETELACPRCQAQVQSGWLFCPVCAAKLPFEKQQEQYNSIIDMQPVTISIMGCVIDSETGSPLEGAVVKVDSRTIKASIMTDPIGRYSLADLDPRPYVLIASLDGYIHQTQPFIPNATKSKPVNFILCKKPVDTI
ncbi:MAG: carboxypeptidase regulatory-like domain-containing protein [Armatimonadota bacterium]